MPVQALFGLSVLLSFVAYGIIAKLYIVPKLRAYCFLNTKSACYALAWQVRYARL